MNNKKGFISTSLIYAFFIIFVVILLALLGLYANNRILLNRVKSEIKDNLNKVSNEKKYKRLYDEIIAQGVDKATIEAKGDPNFSVVPDSATSGLYATQDEYGTSYYYRGEKNSLSNNVIFAEHQWKIVRINGDGSIRLIYNGTCLNNSCTINSTGSVTHMIAAAWNITNYNDAKYVGYMYGGANGVASTSKEQAQTNETNSNAKTVLDAWYENNIMDTKYEPYIVDNIFCNDRSITNGNGYGASNTEYKAFFRIYTNASNPTPTLKCEQKNDRFTVNDTTLGNGALIYPIGLITTDEAQYGGVGLNPQFNQNHYLYTGQYYFTFSPAWGSSLSVLWGVTPDGRQIPSGYVDDSDYLRGVLNLSSEILVSSGDGTAANPYIIFTK